MTAFWRVRPTKKTKKNKLNSNNKKNGQHQDGCWYEISSWSKIYSFIVSLWLPLQLIFLRLINNFITIVHSSAPLYVVVRLTPRRYTNMLLLYVRLCYVIHSVTIIASRWKQNARTYVCVCRTSMRSVIELRWNISVRSTTTSASHRHHSLAVDLWPDLKTWRFLVHQPVVDEAAELVYQEYPP